MSRFLKKRHYKLVLPGVEYVRSMNNTLSITECINIYMCMAKVSFTEQDVAEIQTMFLARYGSKS